ncbi:MAG TPA: hypothetical protein VGY31_08000, partial [Terriglobia bacterium]|nr:hypothetical protein [Terriglobia bacterium]
MRSFEITAVRAALVIILAAASYHLRPFHLSSLESAILGLVLGILLVGCEIRLQKVSIARLVGAAIGFTTGILAALMMSHLLGMTAI